MRWFTLDVDLDGKLLLFITYVLRDVYMYLQARNIKRLALQVQKTTISSRASATGLHNVTSNLNYRFMVPFVDLTGMFSVVIQRSDDSSEREEKATSRCFRKHHRKHRTEIEDMKKRRETCRKERMRNAPVDSDHKSFSTPERLSQTRQISQIPDFHVWECPQDVGVSRLRLHKLEVDSPSTVESRSSISGGVEPNFDSEFEYIYAESIKGCHSSCYTTPVDCNTPNTLVKTDICKEQDPASVWNGFDKESEDPDCDLYVSSNVPGCSVEATAGSGYSCYTSRLKAGRFGSLIDDFDFNSTCIYTDWDRRADSTETDHRYSLIQGSGVLLHLDRATALRVHATPQTVTQTYKQAAQIQTAVV